jgi:hypothetical protein
MENTHGSIALNVAQSDYMTSQAAEDADGVRNVRTSGNGEVHERCDSADVGHGAHEGFVIC